MLYGARLARDLRLARRADWTHAIVLDVEDVTADILLGEDGIPRAISFVRL